MDHILCVVIQISVWINSHLMCLFPSKTQLTLIHWLPRATGKNSWSLDFLQPWLTNFGANIIDIVWCLQNHRTFITDAHCIGFIKHVVIHWRDTIIIRKRRNLYFVLCFLSFYPCSGLKSWGDLLYSCEVGLKWTDSITLIYDYR